MPEPTVPRALHWGAEALWERLAPLLPGLSVEVVRSVGSTNTALLARARVSSEVEVTSGDVQVRRSVESGAFGRRAVDVAPCLLVAEHQTAGRGRQGRSWQSGSAAGASLTFSLGLPLAVDDWSGLSLAVGVGLCEAIDEVRTPDSNAPRLGLKWPNDLWLGEPGEGGRKLGGLLIETVAAGARRFAVIGVGINIEPFAADAITSGFACAQELDPAISAPMLLERIALPLVRSVREFADAGFASAFATRFAERDLLAGKLVQTTSGDVPEGIAHGVSAHGALLLQTPQGVREVTSGEVSVRVAPSSAPPDGGDAEGNPDDAGRSA
ncbi:MAG TPA: biotin--[acetyl-CoA-carboxylase] ligase [Burkholderiaceae bacterium]|nr:biotin--[acetyl-CoA-carboxylase] ligase [Burkholderiaceae bacterium]